MAIGPTMIERVAAAADDCIRLQLFAYTLLSPPSQGPLFYQIDGHLFFPYPFPSFENQKRKI